MSYVLDNGLGSYLESSESTLLLKGGKLQLWQDGEWKNKLQIEIELAPNNCRLLKELIEQDLHTFTHESLQITKVDCKMPNKLGSHDCLGYFAGGPHMSQCTGLVTVEKKIFGWYGFDSKVAECKKEVKARFTKLVAKDTRITGQLLSISELRDASILQTTVYFLAGPDEDSQWQP